jgi:allophanate hydrolase subunit 2
MVSEAVAPGAVQITNEGLPIILGVDGQTIGGYPKIAHVIRADLDRIGQLRPGQVIRFVRTGLDEAETLARKRNRKLRKWLAALKLAAI